MEIVGIGTDLVEVARIKAFAEKQNALERIFSEEEIAYCRARKNCYQHLAVRFAAKEAVYKALPFDGFAFKDIQVANLENGRPQVRVNDKRMDGLAVQISLSHTDEYACAMVVVQR
ncbi:MAG: holo-[acyl-carrier-protein] synthase [Elusimicrobium sp.]|uniref:Holo-[acyl-carrier-protein] synthase n=1 Tax=Candidatus Avelusimicrobium gallicola TaxID=2562704 RepID=A0A928DNQ3_9BACT|nr:holo-[acyl-carrier-protein] synthase [Elusimicrobium sp.]